MFLFQTPRRWGIGMRNLYCISLFVLIGLTKIGFVSGNPGDWKFPDFNASKDAFRKFSDSLEDVDKERAKKLKELGYNENFRVISFNSICKWLGKGPSDFDDAVKNYEKTLRDWIQSLPCSFHILTGIAGNSYNISSGLLPDFFEEQKRFLLATCLASKWSEKQKQTLALLSIISKGKNYSLRLQSGTGISSPTSFSVADKGGEKSARVISLSQHMIFDKKLLKYLLHEFNHALHYELGLSGDPTLCSYKTKFIRDVYQISSPGYGPVLKSGCTIKNVYIQCPDIALDWDIIEEAWNMLGFVEIDGVVYINEFSDCALSYDTKREDGKKIKFKYHHPGVMLPYFLTNSGKISSYTERQNCMILKDYRTDKLKEFDTIDKNDKDGSRYLEAISVALNVRLRGNNSQVSARSKLQKKVEWGLRCLGINSGFLRETNGTSEK